ncbi:hypothetical protein LVJ85_05515 [Neisseria sp. Dent CA1/247]|uniref:baseplate hub protein n=1 Tax=Neisseria sp. Dent CA1/247 TaxID=2912675 RepID=UPI001FD35CA3|nr:hypothetical protein [Neisseria sp. Dent CA1/247]UOO77919.1 hypothetical protein LVJ85_05515 [Neisseria sp. Dent CA1/247]
MNLPSLKEKKIKATVLLGSQDKVFDQKGNNTLVFDGLRTECRINYGNGSVMPSAQIRIYGLRLENMLSLLRVKWNTTESLQNLIQIEAGDADKMAVVYKGNITFARTDFTTAPNASLIIESNTAIYHNLAPTPPRSFEGEIDVAQAIEMLAKDMGMMFENNGVNVKLQNQYLPDTALKKVQALAKNAGCDLYIDNDTIAIAPKDAPRMIDVPVISPSTGLIGYPVPDLIGVNFSCLYDSSLRFGGLVEIENSLITQCNGRWRIFGMAITLESLTPNGKWEVFIKAASAESDVKHVSK